MSLPPFELVVRQYGPVVLRVCRARLSATDADDAWSATFLGALRAYPSLDPDANIEAWLVTIAKRKAIDIHRAQQRQPIPVADVTDSLSDLGIPGRAADDVWAYVAALPHRQRLAVTCRYAGGLTYQQVAAVIGGTPEAARRAAADGVRNLRTRYPRGGCDD